MKRLIIIILLSAVATFSQNVSPQFSELKGMEDQSGNTHLFYRIYTSGFGTMGFYYSNNIWRIEPSSGIDTFFLGDGGFADLFDEVNDYDFWGNNYRKYIYAGTHIYIEPTPEVYRYDQIDPIFISPIWGGSKNIELSRQDTNLIIVSFTVLITGVPIGATTGIRFLLDMRYFHFHLLMIILFSQVKFYHY